MFMFGPITCLTPVEKHYIKYCLGQILSQYLSAFPALPNLPLFLLCDETH